MLGLTCLSRGAAGCGDRLARGDQACDGLAATRVGQPEPANMPVGSSVVRGSSVTGMGRLIVVSQLVSRHAAMKSRLAADRFHARHPLQPEMSPTSGPRPCHGRRRAAHTVAALA